MQTSDWAYIQSMFKTGKCGRVPRAAPSKLT
jgi:hypothetical protein